MYNSIMFSPDGEYVMVTTVEKPFSYLVPYRRFPSKTIIYSKDGQMVETILEVPLIEDLPKGFMAVRKGKRRFSWRNDLPASLVYAEALDEGDPEKEVLYRDEVFQLDAPFNGEPKSLMKTINRYDSAVWGDEDTALIIDDWWNTRNTKTYLINPSDSSIEPKILFDRNYQDRYSDPGDSLMGPGILKKDNSLLLIRSTLNRSKRAEFINQDIRTNLKTLQVMMSTKMSSLSDWNHLMSILTILLETLRKMSLSG